MTAAGTHEAPRRKITRRRHRRRHRARLVVKNDYSIALYEVWSLCGAQICSKFSLLLHKNTKNSSMHICNGCWAEIEDHAYITRCGHQFCASSFLFYTTVFTTLAKVFLFLVCRFCRRFVVLSLFFFFLRIFYY